MFVNGVLDDAALRFERLLYDEALSLACHSEGTDRDATWEATRVKLNAAFQQALMTEPPQRAKVDRPIMIREAPQAHAPPPPAPRVEAPHKDAQHQRLPPTAEHTDDASVCATPAADPAVKANTPPSTAPDSEPPAPTTPAADLPVKTAERHTPPPIAPHIEPSAPPTPAALSMPRNHAAFVSVPNSAPTDEKRAPSKPLALEEIIPAHMLDDRSLEAELESAANHMMVDSSVEAELQYAADNMVADAGQRTNLALDCRSQSISGGT
jgi:hypothetical protein